jgi:hypothetical protein
VLALEPAPGVRVLALPEALDRAEWAGHDVIVIRIAPDEALGLGASGVDVDDPGAIVEPEGGFVVARLDEVDLRSLAAHTDWSIPTEPGTLAQGKIAGVPAKLLIGEPSLLITQTAYADELTRRVR